MLFWSLALANNFVISLISSTFAQIHKHLMLYFWKEKLFSCVVTIYLFGYSLHARKYNVPFFRMVQACEGHVLPSMDLASKMVSKLLIILHHHFSKT